METLVESKYLTWMEIGDAGTEKIVNIVRADARDEFSPFTNKEQKTAFLYTREFPKGMVLNKTNYKTLCKVLGVDHSKWNGKRIILVVKEEKIKGELINVLRIAKQLPPQETPAEKDKRKAATAKTSAAVWGEEAQPAKIDDADVKTAKGTRLGDLNGDQLLQITNTPRNMANAAIIDAATRLLDVQLKHKAEAQGVTEADEKGVIGQN